MIFKKIIGLTALVLALSACSDGSDSSGPSIEVRPALDLTFSEPPIALPNITADFAAEVPYGEAERNVFDVFIPDCSDPTPLVIYIHGGGFTGGDKSAPYGRPEQVEQIQEFLSNCVAYATINYTLLQVPEEDGDLEAAAAQGGFLASLNDTARALQFLRYHYESLNIDPENVASYGISAGASASLWMGTKDDMADPDNEDPVLRESTRLKAVGAIITQATLDVLDWEEILLPITEPLAPIIGGTDVPTLAALVGATNYLLTSLGISSIDQLDSAELAEYRASIDALELMDSGDAPIYTHNYETNLLVDPFDALLHHALHALRIKERADEVGLEAVAYSDDPNFPLEDPSGEGLVSFLLGHIM